MFGAAAAAWLTEWGTNLPLWDMRHPSVRSAILSDYASLARAVGLDPQAMLKAVVLAETFAKLS